MTKRGSIWWGMEWLYLLMLLVTFATVMTHLTIVMINWYQLGDEDKAFGDNTDKKRCVCTIDCSSRLCSSWSIIVTLPSKTSHIDTFHEILIFTHLYRAFIFLSNDTKIMQICLQVQKLLINQSGYRTKFHSEKLGWENSFRIQQYYSSYNLKCLKLW